MKYYEGDGVERDFKKAVYCFKLASDQGHLGALFQLGVMCRKAEGVPLDFKRAAKYITRAADCGSADAQLYLAEMYRSGDPCVSFNREKQEHYYRLAAAQGSAEAMYRLGEYKIYSSNSEEAQTGYNLLINAARKGHKEAQSMLSYKGVNWRK